MTLPSVRFPGVLFLLNCVGAELMILFSCLETIRECSRCYLLVLIQLFDFPNGYVLTIQCDVMHCKLTSRYGYVRQKTK
jgi:hypothetical protein